LREDEEKNVNKKGVGRQIKGKRKLKKEDQGALRAYAFFKEIAKTAGRKEAESRVLRRNDDRKGGAKAIWGTQGYPLPRRLYHRQTRRDEKDTAVEGGGDNKLEMKDGHITFWGNAPNLVSALRNHRLRGRYKEKLQKKGGHR